MVQLATLRGVQQCKSPRGAASTGTSVRQRDNAPTGHMPPSAPLCVGASALPGSSEHMPTRSAPTVTHRAPKCAVLWATGLNAYLAGNQHAYSSTSHASAPMQGWSEWLSTHACAHVVAVNTCECAHALVGNGCGCAHAVVIIACWRAPVRAHAVVVTACVRACTCCGRHRVSMRKWCNSIHRVRVQSPVRAHAAVVNACFRACSIIHRARARACSGIHQASVHAFSDSICGGSSCARLSCFVLKVATSGAVSHLRGAHYGLSPRGAVSHLRGAHYCLSPRGAVSHLRGAHYCQSPRGAVSHLRGAHYC